MPQEIARELACALTGEHRAFRSPSAILDIFLQSDTKIVARARANGLQVINDLFNQYISSGCAIFIDSFDQAINTAFPDNLQIWCNGQTGLLKAAWELSRHNRHAKIFVTVRQEAYSYFRDPEKNNIKGSALLIEYNDRDLKIIFEKAIAHYEKLSSVEEFLGVKNIYNGYLRMKEDSFGYICRHTIGVPRWLMVIGESISNARQGRGILTEKTEIKKQQKLISMLVNQKSAELSRDYLMDEMAAFYRGDTPERFINGCLAKIGSTVLSIESLKRITEKLIESGWSGTTHPFCLLYNLGLLGHVARSADATRNYQKFQKPYQFDWNYHQILPKRAFKHYLLHPALHNLVQVQNGSFRFNKVRIGDNLPWTPKQEKQVRAETIRIFISYAHSDSIAVSAIANLMDDYLNAKSVLHDIWFDQWKMRAGKWFQDQMEEGLTDSDYLVLIASKASLASSAVAVEWKIAFGDKISSDSDRVFPFLLDGTRFEDLPKYLSNIFAYRYEDKRENVIRLVEDILYWHEVTP